MYYTDDFPAAPTASAAAPTDAAVRDAFARAVALDLQARFRPFDLGELLDYACAMWPLMRDDADPQRWADEFLAAR
jgi:hypothetical protein